MDQSHLLAYGLVGLAFLYLLARLVTASSPNLNHIPTVGPSGPLSSYLGALRFLRHSHEMVKEGYQKHPNGMFKIAMIDKWVVYCCGHQLTEDIGKASDNELSVNKAVDQLLQTKYTLGEILDDPYHILIIRNTLTRNLEACFPVIHDEIVQSFEDILSLQGNEWKAVPAMEAMLSIACRTVNRVFVGIPLCRDPDYLDLTKQFTIDVMVISTLLNLLPEFLKPIVGRCITKLPTYVKRAAKHLSPILEERMKMEEQHGKDWPDKPNDGITWLLEQAEGSRRTHRDLILRILTVNLAANHTTSMSFTHALYHLAANPEYAVSLREEVEPIIKEEGWTKSAINRMVKVDSFLKESQRLNGIGTFTTFRVVLKDFTFSDGTVLPAGSSIVAPLSPTHRDEAIYSNPEVFEPYRFSRLRELGSNAAKMQLTTPSPDFLTWGIGKHPCPGRFFASIGLKTMLAHTVVSYDVKVKNEGVRPSNEWFGGYCTPNRNAEVMFRRRAV